MGDFVHVYEPGTPTLVLLHGTGGNENQMLEFGKSLLPQAGYLSVRGQELEQGTVTRWFRRFGEGVFDEDNMRMRAQELSDFVSPYEHPRIAVGYSNGANMAAAVLLLYPLTFDGAVLFASMVPLTPDPMPELGGKRILMVSGKRDTMVPAENAEQLEAMFRAAGADVEMRWHEGGHEIPPGEFRRAGEWLQSL